MKWLLIYWFLISSALMAQDERVYRSMMEPRDLVMSNNVKLKSSTPHYLVDLNRNGVEEAIVFEKRDGVDVLRVTTSQGEKLFEGRFHAKGHGARPLKVRLVSIADSIYALMVFYYEGTSGGFDHTSSARLYLATFSQKESDKFYWEKGPAYFFEKDRAIQSYILREKSLLVTDLNGDGVKEIIIDDKRSKSVLAFDISRWEKRTQGTLEGAFWRPL